jgi:ABC-type sugar transport system permease subunit
VEIIDLLAASPALFIVTAALVGLVVGSFLNVVIHRLPIMMEREWRTQCTELLNQPQEPVRPFNLWTPSSRCPACEHRIGAMENIPLLSYALQRGRCAHCQTPISIQYPLIEVLSGVLAAIIAWQFGFGWPALAALLLTWALIALSGIDFRYQLLPDNITLPFLWLGLGLALALNSKIKGRDLFRLLIALPWILSELVVAYIWLYLYQPSGTINDLLNTFGLPTLRWLSSSGSAIWALVITNIWFGTPFTMLTLGSALTTINPELNDAAAVDGANRRQTFRFITWPLLAPFAALNLILITMWTVNLFAMPLAMTNGGPIYATTTTSLYMYRHAFEFGNFSIGSSIGVMLLVFNLVATAVYVRALRGQT